VLLELLANVLDVAIHSSRTDGERLCVRPPGTSASGWTAYAAASWAANCAGPGRGRGESVRTSYQALADMALSQGQLAVQISNPGTETVNLALYAHQALTDSVQRFDVNLGGSARATVTPDALRGAYDVELHGPNGFLRRASGSLLSPEAGVEAALGLPDANRDHPKLKLALSNNTAHPQSINVRGLHDMDHRFELAAHMSNSVELDPLEENHGWYDLVVTVKGATTYRREFAGQLENGQPSRTAPE
jgi:phospholipase C